MPSQEEALQQALQQALRAFRRDAAAASKAAREQEASDKERCLADLRARMERERDDQLRQQKAVLDREMLAEMRKLEAQHRAALTAARRLELELQGRVRDAERQALEASSAANAPCVQCGNYSRLKQEAAMLLERAQAAESRLEVCIQADREKAEDLRKMSEQHAEELTRLKREATLETQRLLDELRAKQRAVTQLERDLHEHASRIQIQADCIQASRTTADGPCGNMGSMRDWVKDSVKKGVPRRELESLQRLLEDREQEIAALRQAAKDKDRRLEQLTSRYRREQMRHYYRQFVELEPVVELEEDSEGEGSTASSGSPALSPAPGDGWGKMTGPSYHEELYLELLREHSELQDAYQRAQFDARLLRGLQAELAQAKTQARDLRRALRDAISAGRSARSQEAKLADMQAREAVLQAENAELRDQNELLEFRILEVENLASGRCADTKDASTDTAPDDALDWCTVSLEEALNDADQGVHDMMACEHEDLRSRLLNTVKSLQHSADRSCVLQAMAALDACHDKHLLLGRAACDKSGRAVATVLPFKEAAGDDRPAECLQESGIFEGDELEAGVSQATQTELGPSPLGDLRTEILKLSQIREKIEERGELLPGHQRHSAAAATTPHHASGDCDEAHECCRKLHDKTVQHLGEQSGLEDAGRLDGALKGRVRELEERERAYQATMLRAEEMMQELQEHCAGLVGAAQRTEGDLRRQLQVCEEENDRLRWRLEELEQGHTALSDRLQRGEEERGKLRTDAEQLQRELEQCKEEVAAPLQAALLQERRLCQGLRAQLEDMHRELARTDKEHKEKINDLKKQLGDAQKTAVDYECTVSELREEVDTLEVAVTQLGAEVSRHQDKERGLRAELESLRAELEQRQALSPVTSRELQSSPSVHEELVMLDQLELAMAELDSGVEDFLEVDPAVRQVVEQESPKPCPRQTSAGRKQTGCRGARRQRPADPKTPSPPPRQHSVHSVKEFLQRPPASALPEDCKRAVRAAMEARRELAGAGLSQAVLHVRSCANCSCVLKSLLSAISEKMRDLSNIMVSKKCEPLPLDGVDKVAKVKEQVAATVPRSSSPQEAVDDSCSEGSPRPNRPRRRLRSPPRQKPQWPQVTTTQWQC